MEELKYIEENAYWEFQLLDSRGIGCLRVSEALTLARYISCIANIKLFKT